MVLLVPSTKDQLGAVGTRIAVGGFDIVLARRGLDHRPYYGGQVVGAYSDPYGMMAAMSMIEVQEL